MLHMYTKTIGVNEKTKPKEKVRAQFININMKFVVLAGVEMMVESPHLTLILVFIAERFVLCRK